MALDLVSDYITEARVLLQDTWSGGYRYADSELVIGLNMALLEARRLRPDLFIGVSTIPTYSETAQTTAVVFEPMYRVALVYYICGNAQLRDDEQTEDARATVFLNKFVAMLSSLPS